MIAILLIIVGTIIISLGLAPLLSSRYRAKLESGLWREKQSIYSDDDRRHVNKYTRPLQFVALGLIALAYGIYLLLR